MNIIVLGAGAIGSLFGAKLSQKNHVTLIGKKKHVDSVRSKGLRFTGAENKRFDLKARTGLTTLKPGTVVLLTTKVYDSEKAIKRILPLLRKDTTIVCMQNGYDAHTVVKRLVKNKCLVLRGITAVGVSYTEPGFVKVNHMGYTLIEKSARSREIAKNFDSCGLKANVSRSINRDIWKKLIVNCMLNPATAILKLKNKEIARPELRRMMLSIGEECLAVARKDGVYLPRKYISEILDFIVTSDNLSSMYQDILKGKKTEIDYLNGAVVSLGKIYGVKTPVNEALVGMVKVIEK